MATKTSYLKMGKPEKTDKISPDDYNANFDLLDSKIKTIDTTGLFVESFDATTGVLKTKTGIVSST